MWQKLNVKHGHNHLKGGIHKYFFLEKWGAEVQTFVEGNTISFGYKNIFSALVCVFDILTHQMGTENQLHCISSQ